MLRLFSFIIYFRIIVTMYKYLQFYLFQTDFFIDMLCPTLIHGGRELVYFHKNYHIHYICT